jgi:hypothetical protein
VAQLPQIAQLEARRRELVAESERHRQQLTAELEQLRSAATWVETGFSLARSLRTYWPVLAAGAALFGARKRGSLLGALGKGLSLWRLVKKLSGLWGRRAPEPESSR